MKKLWLLLCVVVAVSATQVVVNSRDWQDVYAALAYANVNNYEARFLASAPHADYLHELLPKDEVILIESVESPWVINYGSVLESNGFNVVETIESSGDAHLTLAKKMNANRFIVVDDHQGYNAISVAPYAIATGSAVVFANEDNVEEVSQVVSSLNPSSTLLYGPVTPKVEAAFQNAERVNKGNRFSNNIEMVKRFQELKGAQQVYLSNGEFIEIGLFKGNYPVLFIGSDETPSEQIDYLLSSEIRVGVVIGNELVNTAKKLKDMGALDSIFVRYAQGWGSGGGFSEVRGLDLMYLPVFDLDVSIALLQYNTETGAIELTLENNAESQFAFAKTTITVLVNGEEKVFGDAQAIYLAAGKATSVSYQADLNEIIAYGASAVVRTLYGEDSNSLEKVIEQEFDPLYVVSVKDESTLSIRSLEYSKGNQELYLTLSSETGAFAHARITVAGEAFETRGAPVQVGEETIVTIPAEFEYEKGLKAEVEVAYGARENMLLKKEGKIIEVWLKSEFEANLLLGGLVIVIVILVAYIFNTRNAVTRKRQRGKNKKKR